MTPEARWKGWAVQSTFRARFVLAVERRLARDATPKRVEELRANPAGSHSRTCHHHAIVSADLLFSAALSTLPGSEKVTAIQGPGSGDSGNFPTSDVLKLTVAVGGGDKGARIVLEQYSPDTADGPKRRRGVLCSRRVVENVRRAALARGIGL